MVKIWSEVLKTFQKPTLLYLKIWLSLVKVVVRFVSNRLNSLLRQLFIVTPLLLSGSSISPFLWVSVIIPLHQFSGQWWDFNVSLKKVTRKGSIIGAPVMIILLLMKSFPLAFLSFSSLIPFEISSVVNRKSRIGSCFSSGGRGGGFYCYLLTCFCHFL